jgi:hypothetical protein
VTRVNLDARRAQLEEHEVVLDGREYRLPAHLPLVVAEHMMAGRFQEAIRGMFGEQLDTAQLASVTLDDVLTIAREAYGLSPGESPASSQPSPSNGMRSTPTSSGSTD